MCLVCCEENHWCGNVIKWNCWYVNEKQVKLQMYKTWFCPCARNRLAVNTRPQQFRIYMRDVNSHHLLVSLKPAKNRKYKNSNKSWKIILLWTLREASNMSWLIIYLNNNNNLIVYLSIKSKQVVSVWLSNFTERELKERELKVYDLFLVIQCICLPCSYLHLKFKSNHTITSEAPCFWQLISPLELRVMDGNCAVCFPV